MKGPQWITDSFSFLLIFFITTSRKHIQYREYRSIFEITKYTPYTFLHFASELCFMVLGSWMLMTCQYVKHRYMPRRSAQKRKKRIYELRISTKVNKITLALLFCREVLITWLCLMSCIRVIKLINFKEFNTILKKINTRRQLLRGV